MRTPKSTSKPRDWFCASYRLPDPSMNALLAWAAAQPWPDGTDLKGRDKLHITAFYSRTGFSEAAHHAWLAERPCPPMTVRALTVECFDVGDGGGMIPVVVTWDAPELEAHAADLTDAAERRGLTPVRHADGYRPHTTIAFAPEPVTLAVPDLAAQTAGLFEQHTHNQALKTR